MVEMKLESVALVFHSQRRAAERPAGSWFMAIMAGLERMERSAGFMLRMSLPMIRGLLAAAPEDKSALSLADSCAI